MDASTIPTRQDIFTAPASPPQSKNLENTEPAIETKSDNDQDDNQNVSNETVKLSDTSLKLSTSSPVKSSDRSTTVENRDQAQQVVSQIIADFQSNPSQAQGAHSNIFAGAVKSLLG